MELRKPYHASCYLQRRALATLRRFDNDPANKKKKKSSEMVACKGEGEGRESGGGAALLIPRVRTAVWRVRET